MTASAFKAKFARLGRIRAIGLEQSGSPELVSIRAGADIRKIDTIAAITLLVRGGVVLLRAKRSIEAVMDGAQVVLEVPRVADTAAFERDMQACGFVATVRSPEAPDIRSLRERFGLSQEEFAARFGLELDAVRNWEQGSHVPDTAARTLLKVIARQPEAVQAALDRVD